MTPTRDQYEPVTLITGAASGIGAATARRMAVPGVKLMLHTRRNLDRLEAVASACRNSGAVVETGLGDLTAPEETERLVLTCRKAFGRIDQFIANAGGADRRQFGELADADLVAAHAAMPLAFFRLVTAMLDELAASPIGRVVAVSSFVAHVFGVNDSIFPATAAAKAAIEALAKALAFQLAPTGTTVNVVAPGYTQKDPGAHAAIDPAAWEAARNASPSGTLAQPDDVAAAIAFFASRDAGHITGQVLLVDGGLSLR